MPIKSQYANKCKDCGIPYEVGDEISTNGNKSPNKSGELKDHWCINGKNCQGVMQLQAEGINPSGFDLYVKEPGEPLKPLPTKEKEEPTPEEIITFVRSCGILDEDIIRRDGEDAEMACLRALVRKARIEDIMNQVGIKHPSRVSFMTEVMRRLS